MRNFDHRFALKSGVQIYVQDDSAREQGDRLCGWIEKRWRPPAHFYHFRDGGHVAAARLHEGSPFIMAMDLRRFFDQVSRTKVHRALRLIRFSSADAFELAREATVSKDGAPGYSLPFGFVQSMHLASLALDCSALGRALNAVSGSGVLLSTYVDDVLMSADRPDALYSAQAQLEAGANAAGFAFSPAKTRGPADRVSAFNLWIGRNQLRVTDNRFNEFRETVRRPPEIPAESTIAYVRTVNESQADALVADRKAAGF